MPNPTETSDRTQNALNNNTRIESWKGIASYLARGLRTVRRWEQEEGLPVHRHMHHKQGTIYALTGEIDNWLKERSESGNFSALHRPSHTGSGNGSGGLSSEKERYVRPVVIAVLPHSYPGDNSFEKHLAEGLAEAILSKLGKLDPDQIHTVAYSTVMQYIKCGRSVSQLCRDLNVDYMLEAGGRIQDVHVRLVACLIDARNQIQVWADSLELEIPSPLLIQQQFADALLKTLVERLGLPSSERRRSPPPMT
jgi:TolB-like protein